MTALDAPRSTLDVRAVRRQAAATGPWTREQIATLAVVDLAAAALILIAAWNARGTHSTAHGIAWLMVALLGLGVSGTAHAVFLQRARRVLALAIAVVVEPISATIGGDSSNRFSGADLVRVAGSQRYHRAECAFVVGREVLAADSAGEPCEVCRP